MPSYSGYLVETLVTLAGVCALAVVVLWAARRAGIARSSGPIELRGYLPLEARRAIYLVKVGATVFIVGVGEGGFTKLGEVADAALPAGDRARGLNFAHVLARVRGSGAALSARLGGEAHASAGADPALPDAALGTRRDEP